MNMLIRSLLACLPLACLSIFASDVAQAQTSWNRFRGENGVGGIAVCNAPLPWTEQDVAWSVKLPGKGNSSPIIQSGHAYVLSGDPSSAERFVLAYDVKDGKEVWRASFPSSKHPLHTRSSYASSTPCADDKAVYVSWGWHRGVLF